MSSRGTGKTLRGRWSVRRCLHEASTTKANAVRDTSTGCFSWVESSVTCDYLRQSGDYGWPNLTFSLRYSELNVEWRRQHDDDLPKNQEFYPAVIRAGLEGTTVREELDLD